MAAPQLGQLGFDWNVLIGAGANIASAVGSGVTGSAVTPTYGITGTSTAPGTSITQQPWFLPLAIGVGIYFFFKK